MDWSWKKKASCAKRLDLDWYADEPTMEHIIVCDSCPVIESCLDEAMTMEPGYDPGVRAGMGPVMRGNIRRRLKVQGARR